METNDFIHKLQERGYSISKQLFELCVEYAGTLVCNRGEYDEEERV